MSASEATQVSKPRHRRSDRPTAVDGPAFSGARPVVDELGALLRPLRGRWSVVRDSGSWTACARWDDGEARVYGCDDMIDGQGQLLASLREVLGA